MVRITRFHDADGATHYGLEHSGGLVTLADGCPFAGTLRDTGRKAVVAQYLPPVPVASVICIGLNYFKHADELKLPYPKNPVVFTKPAFSACGHLSKVVKPRITEKMDYEVELAVVIGTHCKDVTVEEALDYVLGYTVANDLSTRDWQKVPELSGSQWCRSKGFDGFSPLGPVLVTKDEIQDPNSLGVRCFVNGDKRQDSRTNDLIFKVQEIVSFLSSGCTLEPGTVILTGTPAGVAEGMKGQPWVQVGDTIVTEIENIGALEVQIVEDPSKKKCYMNAPSAIMNAPGAFMNAPSKL